MSLWFPAAFSCSIIRIRPSCALSMPRGPSCGTSAENRAPIVCCCNPTQWHRAQIKGCGAAPSLCRHKYKQWATTKARGQLGLQFNVVYATVARATQGNLQNWPQCTSERALTPGTATSGTENFLHHKNRVETSNKKLLEFILFINIFIYSNMLILFYWLINWLISFS